ncbi:transcription repressor NadR [Agathobaculum sp.]|uniref:transcription repressor NadR n=1 Tax=Agathobaculum sp. TaxID=2048138 RepID=UPI002A8158A2|nr:transcription repressor NadR [Agathobaculum sp.]MDY3617855.1 transcription repressor NadR [Agathobaculum sp.]
MNADERRTAIQQLLAQTDGPVSATALAARCGVSRQIIVGDVALLRAGGLSVLATPRGYMLEASTAAPAFAERSVACRHENDRMMEELYTVVDLGGSVIDVTVEHAVYGQLCGQLHICSRFDADAFGKKLEASDVKPLCNLTGGIHLHRIRAANDATLARVIQGLRERGFLFSEEIQTG